MAIAKMNNRFPGKTSALIAQKKNNRSKFFEVKPMFQQQRSTTIETLDFRGITRDSKAKKNNRISDFISKPGSFRRYDA